MPVLAQGPREVHDRSDLGRRAVAAGTAGHLENISDNLFSGVVNAFTGASGKGRTRSTGTTRAVPDIAKQLSAAGVALVRRRRRRTTAKVRHASTRPWNPATGAAW